MHRMAVTPCCGTIREPPRKTEIARYRSVLRLGICPLCGLDLAATLNGETLEQARAKIWFHTNAYKSVGSPVWQWSDDEALIFHQIMARWPDDQIDPLWDRWIALDPYTGTLNIAVPLDDQTSVLSVKRAGGWYAEQGCWKVTPEHSGLIEMLRTRGYIVLPSVELAVLYQTRRTA